MWHWGCLRLRTYLCCPLEQFSISLCSVQHATSVFIILSIHRNIKGSIIQIFFYAQNHEDGLGSAVLSCNNFFYHFEGSPLCLCLYMKIMSAQMSFQDVTWSSNYSALKSYRVFSSRCNTFLSIRKLMFHATSVVSSAIIHWFKICVKL